MAKKYQYCVAECWGKGFIKKEDAQSFSITGFPGNVWQVPINNQDANLWLFKVNAVRKTLQEAQALVNQSVQQSQIAWDALPEDQKIGPGRSRPTDIVLDE